MYLGGPVPRFLKIANSNLFHLCKKLTKFFNGSLEFPASDFDQKFPHLVKLEGRRPRNALSDVKIVPHRWLAINEVSRGDSFIGEPKMDMEEETTFVPQTLISREMHGLFSLNKFGNVSKSHLHKICIELI